MQLRQKEHTVPAGWRDGPLPRQWTTLRLGEVGEPLPSPNEGSFEDAGRIDGRSIDLDTMRPVYDAPPPGDERSRARPAGRRRREPTPEWDAPSIA
jgi:hypothetical protein